MITRRNFLKAGATLVAGATCRPPDAFGAELAANGPRLTLPTPAQVAWQDCEVGVIFDFDLAVAAGDLSGNNTGRKTFDPARYQPRQLYTDQWMEAAKACGARYAIFTATHFNGFMQWQSDLYPYGLKQTTWRDGKGDVVADFVASCRKAGIKPGIFFSVNRNAYNQVHDHYVDWSKGRGTPAQEVFNRIAEKQMEEICSRYGPLIQIWFDNGTKTPVDGGPDMLPIFERYQPDGIFYSSAQRAEHRWIGNEKGFANDPCWSTMPGKGGPVSHNSPTWQKILGTGDPDGDVWSPGMVDVPLRGANKVHSWFWKPDQEHAVESTEKLVQMYLESVGRNCNFVIGEVITPEGLVPEFDIRRLAEFGREVERRWGKPVAETTGRGTAVELKLPRPARIESVAIMENIARGERIQEFVISGKASGGQWQELSRGQSVGHKRIATFPAIELSAVRLDVKKEKAEPLIRKLASYAAA